MQASGLLRRVAARTIGESDLRVGRREDIRLRNYDGDAAHTVRVEARDDDGVAFAETYRLEPGTTASLASVLGDGRYEVAAELEGGAAASAECRIDEWPEGTALIEVGNGAVAVSDADPYATSG